jgi:hypothetical protein
LKEKRAIARKLKWAKVIEVFIVIIIAVISYFLITILTA